MTEYYKNNLLEGDYIDYYSNGELEEKGSYLNGEKNGKWLSFYYIGNEKIESQCSFKEGKKVGDCITFKNKSTN
jgi:antitoxin component YwqK of YwqJK toxin-antitoxin module